MIRPTAANSRSGTPGAVQSLRASSQQYPEFLKVASQRSATVRGPRSRKRAACDLGTPPHTCIHATTSANCRGHKEIPSGYNRVHQHWPPSTRGKFQVHTQITPKRTRATLRAKRYRTNREAHVCFCARPQLEASQLIIIIITSKLKGVLQKSAPTTRAAGATSCAC